MTDSELKKLKDNLWHSADMLRASAHLAANKYGQPILGLIFLRYADILFKQHKQEIDEEYTQYKGTRMEKSYKDVAVEKCGFFLPECAFARRRRLRKRTPRWAVCCPKRFMDSWFPKRSPNCLAKLSVCSKTSPKISA